MTDRIDDSQPPSARRTEGVTDETEPVAGVPDGDKPLQARRDRPADSGWREPPWFPPRDRDRGHDRRSSTAAIVFGLILIAVGAYYFLDRTLGLRMPSIQWGSIWPIILIVIGGLILLRSLQRRA